MWKAYFVLPFFFFFATEFYITSYLVKYCKLEIMIRKKKGSYFISINFSRINSSSSIDNPRSTKRHKWYKLPWIMERRYKPLSGFFFFFEIGHRATFTAIPLNRHEFETVYVRVYILLTKLKRTSSLRSRTIFLGHSMNLSSDMS